MPFEPKNWEDAHNPNGLVDAAALIDLEERVTSEAALPESVVRSSGASAGRVPVSDGADGYSWATGSFELPSGFELPPETLWGSRSWFDYRRLAGAVRGDVIVIGDSTTWGSQANYSWVQRIRDDSVAAGIADGGKGIFNDAEAALTYDAPEVNGYVGGTGFKTVPDGYDLFNGAMFYDNGSERNRTVKFQWRGSCARLWFASRATASDFTYSVDGGEPVTVHVNKDYFTGQVLPQIMRFIYIDGLDPDETHTIEVTNLGGKAAEPPTVKSIGSAGPGTGGPNAGTYFYVVTSVFNGIETIGSAPKEWVSDANHREVTLQIPKIGQDSVRLYRGTSAKGPFKLISATSSGSSEVFLAKDKESTNAPTEEEPPTKENPEAWNDAAPACWVTLAGQNNTGLCWQKIARTGATMARMTTGEQEYWKLARSFGLTSLGSDVTNPSNYERNNDSVSGERMYPVLAVLDLGFNDLTGDKTHAAEKCKTGVEIFAAMCEAAGCDGVVLSGQLPLNENWKTYGKETFETLRQTALECGLAFGDFFIPIGGPSLEYEGGSGNPHRERDEYEAQADFLWEFLGSGLS